MKQRIAAVTGFIILLLFLNQNSFAQDTKQFSIGAFVSGMRIGTATIGNADGNFDETAFISGTINYFFTKSFSLELSLSSIKTGVIVEVDEYSGKMGDIRQVPVLLTGSFHFPINKSSGNFYLGAGAGYYFHDFDNTGKNKQAEFFAMNIEANVEDSIGGHFAVGGEFFISKNWTFNLDMKGVFNKAEFTLRNERTKTEIKDVALNAFIAGLGIRYYFK